MYGVGQSSSRGRGLWVVVGLVVLGLVLGGLFFAFYTLVLKDDGESPTSEATATTFQLVSPMESTIPPLPTGIVTSEPVALASPVASPVASPMPLASPTMIPTVPPTDTPEPTPTLRPPPEVITIGVRARVNLSEGLSLNLRDLPTLNGSTIITQLVAQTEVDVVEGPEDEGDRRWWNIDSGAGRTGWVVEALGADILLVPVGWTGQLPPLSAPTPAVTPTVPSAVASPTVAPTVTPTVAATSMPAPVATVTPTVTAAPVLTPTATAAPVFTPTATATPVLTPTATPEGGIPSPTVGGSAQVTTKYQYINLRAEPGLGGEAIGQLPNGTVVTILEGPEEVDGFRWWKIDDGQGNIGWAAERVGEEVLLTPIQ